MNCDLFLQDRKLHNMEPFHILKNMEMSIDYIEESHDFNTINQTIVIIKNYSNGIYLHHAVAYAAAYILYCKYKNIIHYPHQFNYSNFTIPNNTQPIMVRNVSNLALAILLPKSTMINCAYNTSMMIDDIARYMRVSTDMITYRFRYLNIIK